MKGLVYGVAVSALVLGTGGLAAACEQHAKSAAMENPAAAARATVSERGFVLAQTQDESAKENAEEGKEKKPEAVKPAVGPLAQSQDDSAKENTEEEKKPEMLPRHDGSFVVAQSQDGDKQETTGEGTKPEGDDQK